MFFERSKTAERNSANSERKVRRRQKRLAEKSMEIQNQKEITFFFGKEKEKKVVTDSPSSNKRKFEEEILGTPGTPSSKQRRA